MKKILLAFALVSSCIISQAIVVQKVYLKNGTVLNGYIQQQDKNDNITFRSESATICINGKNATTTERVYKITELDKKWIDWAENNDAFVGTGDTRTLTLNEIIFNNNNSYEFEDSVMPDLSETSHFENDFKVRHSNVIRVKVLEKGTNIKYLELTPNTYTFNWNDVEAIKADRRSKTSLSGIDRIYQLQNGQEICGQYAGESYNTLSLYTSNGVIETFDINNVTKYFYKGINPNQNIFEQSELIDVVRTKNNGIFRGVIVERNFTDGNNYLIIQQQTGSSQMLKFTDVEEYSKEENSDYSPKFDILLKQGEVVVNRIATDSVGVTKKGTTLVLDSINMKVVVPKEGTSTKIIVEYYNPQHLSSEHLMMVKIDKDVVKKKNVYSFSTDIYDMKKFVPTNVETSINHTTKIEYNLPSQDIYAIYDQQTKKAMPFIIK